MHKARPDPFIKARTEYLPSGFDASPAIVPRVLDIGLLGSFRLTLGDEPLTSVDTPRLQSLFAYLVLHRGMPQIRQHVAFTFWPDSTEKQALTNLRHLLHDLRRALPEADRFIRVDGKTITWRHEAPFVLDVASFEQALARALDAAREANSTTARDALEKAADVYRGDLLPGCYGEWIDPERDRLRQEHGRVLERLLRVLEDRREYAAALHCARRLQQHDPLREATCEALMRLHALHGDRASALRVYDQCVEVLRQELGVSTGPSVDGLRDRLLKAEEPFAATGATAKSRRSDELPLTGRHPEWKQLKAAWREAVRGQARLAVVMGEAGIGKTRLVDELVGWAERQGIATARTRSYATEGRLAYAPVADWLRSEALNAELARLDPVWMKEIRRILPELRPERDDTPDPEPVRESWQRLRLFEALSRATLAGGEPRLVMLDDMHWTDAETLAWLRYLLRWAPEAPLLVAGTIRTESITAEPALAVLLSDLRRDGVLTEITLAPLDVEETSSLAAHVAGRALEEIQAKRLHAETEGNPLFVVETVRAGLLEGEALTAAWPAKVQTVITSRLAESSAGARALAELAATIGRAFTIDVLAAAAGLGEQQLADGLDELWRRHLIREHSPGAYDFSHDKLREGAYREISPARRRRLHHCVSRALETVHANDLDAISGQLAAHYEQAGETEQALRYAFRAGQVAKGVHANEEAIRLFRRALVLLERHPASPERDEQELELQLALGTCLVALQGYGVAEARHVYERALTLCERLGRRVEAPILRALANASLTAGHLQRAYALGEDIRNMARSSEDPVLDVEAQYTLGVASFWMGRFATSRQHLERAIARYDPQQHSLHIMLYAQDPKVVCLCRLGRTLWYLGYPEQAVGKTEDGLSLARVLGHPHSRAYALWTAGHFYLDFGDLDRAQQCVDALLPLAAEQGFSLWTWYGTALRGALLAEQDRVAEGIANLREGLAAWVDTGGGLLGVSQLQGYLAAACQRGADGDAAQAALDVGLALAEKTGERFHEAELYRLRGELLQARGRGADDAATCFRQALVVARRQQARPLELRAAMSLGRLRRRERAEQVRRLLQNVYDGFTEGFDTPDLKAARALLGDLA